MDVQSLKVLYSHPIDLHPTIAFVSPTFRMSANHKRPLSPLATHGFRPPKIPRPFNPAQRVALAEHPQLVIAPQSVQEGDSAPVFTFGGSRGISIFSYVEQLRNVFFSH